MSCRHYLVSGRVQGVFYRASTCDQARSLGLRGWVRNLPDGRVEALACGSDEMLAKLELWLHQGPPMAKVDQVQVQSADEPDCIDFQIR